MNTQKFALKITVNGVVQGVGFRYFIARAAHELRLNGYARNLFTGEVEIYAEGEKTSLEKLIEASRKGPPHSKVKSCKVQWLEFENKYSNFEIF